MDYALATTHECQQCGDTHLPARSGEQVVGGGALLETYDEAAAERDALRKQIDAIWAAWHRSTGWQGFGSETERILRDPDYQPSQDQV